MSRETEKFFKELDKYMAANGQPDSEKDLNAMVGRFVEEYNSSLVGREPISAANARTSDDYLELAEQASSFEEMLRYAKKALKLDPDNLEAEMYVAAIGSTDQFDLLKNLEKAVAHGNKVMADQGYFGEEYIGEFWGFHETRPYMRIRQGYVDALIEVCMFEAAERECEDLLRLSTNDNIGARYTLMALYALHGKEEEALDLLEKYDEDSAMMLLPLAVLYYMKKDLRTSLDYIKKIMKRNTDLKKFLKIAAEQGNTISEDFEPGSYRPYTIEEINTAVFENDWLYATAGMFFIWANKEINEKGKKTGGRKSSGKKKK